MFACHVYSELASELGKYFEICRRNTRKCLLRPIWLQKGRKVRKIRANLQKQVERVLFLCLIGQ